MKNIIRQNAGVSWWVQLKKLDRERIWWIDAKTIPDTETIWMIEMKPKRKGEPVVPPSRSTRRWSAEAYHQRWYTSHDMIRKDGVIAWDWVQTILPDDPPTFILKSPPKGKDRKYAVVRRFEAETGYFGMDRGSNGRLVNMVRYVAIPEDFYRKAYKYRDFNSFGEEKRRRIFTLIGRKTDWIYSKRIKTRLKAKIKYWAKHTNLVMGREHYSLVDLIRWKKECSLTDGSSNGRTTGFGPVYGGSNPPPSSI